MRSKRVTSKHNDTPSIVVVGDGKSLRRFSFLRKRKNKIILGIIVLIVAIGSGLLLYTYQKRPANTATKQQPQSDADQLAQTTIPDDTSDADRARYYKATAAAYSTTDTHKELEFLLKAEQLTPNDKDLQYTIALAYYKLGDTTNQAIHEAKAGKKVDTRSAGSDPCDISEKVCS